MRLFCLPHAGGSAAMYRGWSKLLGPGFEVVPVELPGHGSRARDPLCRSVAGLVDQLLAELRPELAAGPFAIFGHSLGGMIAFQLAHELAQRGLAGPARLFLSAARSPITAGRDPMHQLPDPELLSALLGLNGAALAGASDAEAEAHRELLQFMLPVVRADLRLAETWSFRPAEPLDVPATVLGGLDDSLATPAELASWREFFAGEVVHRWYPGGHFYLSSQVVAVLRDVRAAAMASLRAAE